MFIAHPLVKLERRRQKALDKGAYPEVLAPLFLQALPGPDVPLSALKILSLDFETTGLDVNHDAVLSIGGVEILNGEIDFGTGFHHLLRVPDAKIADTSVIHHLTPEQLISGMDPLDAMQFLISKFAGHLLLCHAGTIELSFFKKTLGLKPSEFVPLIILDTLKIERNLSSFSGRIEDLRLFAIRKKRGLPPYVAHNAFADAVAAAEVLLAQCAEIFGRNQSAHTLGPLYKLQER